MDTKKLPEMKRIDCEVCGNKIEVSQVELLAKNVAALVHDEAVNGFRQLGFDYYGKHSWSNLCVGCHFERNGF